MTHIKIVGIGGSTKRNSTSLAALEIALEGARAVGASTRLFDVRELDLPHFSNEIELPPSAAELVDHVHEAHGLLWSSPLYHGTISGAFKNVIDWLQPLSQREPPYLTNKFVGLISTAGGVQGLQAVNTMEFCVRALRGWAVPLVIPIPRAWKVFEDGRLTDDKLREQLYRLAEEVVAAAEQFNSAGTHDYVP